MTGRTRVDALLADLEALYPGARASTSRTSRGGPHQRRFCLLVSRRWPRLLVPSDSPRATRAAIRRDSANDGLPDVLGRRAVAAVAGSPLGPLLFRDVITLEPVDADSLESHLATYACADVRLSLHSGAATRANAKPVVGVHRTTGAEIGFCKIGITPLAARLVRHEVDALRLLAAADLTALDVPPVLHDSRWNGYDVLLMGALRGNRGRARDLPVEAMREVIQAPGARVVPLRDGPWAAGLRDRLSGASPGMTARIRQTLDTLVCRHGDQQLLHGGCHGDWGPWNMSWAGDRPLVWDWERFTRATPAGVDAAHFVGHTRLRRIGDASLARTAVLDAEAAVRSVLAPWAGGPEAEAAAHTVVLVYLLDLATRLAVDAGSAGPDLVGRMADWYLDVAARQLELTSTSDAIRGSGAAA